MARDSDRRSYIIQSAARVFMRHGYEATSMNLIAKEAAVTKPGLYYHFESKQQLLFTIMGVAMDVLEKDTREATMSTSDNEARLREIIFRHARMIAHQDQGAFTILVIDLTENLLDEDRRLITQRKRAYFETVRAVLKQLEKEDKLRPVDVTVSAFSLLGMVMWISKWFRPKGALSHDEVAVQVTELALGAVLRDDRRGGGLPSLTPGNKPSESR